MTNKIEWGEYQINFVKENYSKLTNPQIALALNIKIQTLRTYLIAMGLKRMELEYWTEEQIKFLIDNYKITGDKELAIIFNKKWYKCKGWTWKHIEKKRLYLKLKRTPSELKKIKQKNIDRGCWKDTSTWETRGEAKIGETRIWQHQQGSVYKVIKTKDGFVHYGPWLYEKTYGKMAQGYVIGYKDGDNLNVIPENIEAITRGEHAIRNKTGKYKYGPELKKLTIALKLLNHTIKTKEDEQRKHS